MLKYDVELLSRLYIVMQHRKSDMSTFFKHDNHTYSPSLLDREQQPGKKSDPLSFLSEETEKVTPVSFEVKVLDGTAIVHVLPTNSVSTFDDHATDVFIPHIRKQLDAAECVDVVWDSYITSSITELTREKTDKGMQ